MAASWPPTSGATRISVMRTTPTMGGLAAERDSRYPPSPAARSPSRPRTPTGRLAMGPPPLHEVRGHCRQREVDDRQDPETPPVPRHLPRACAQLADAHESVDGEIRRKDIADG